MSIYPRAIYSAYSEEYNNIVLKTLYLQELLLTANNEVDKLAVRNQIEMLKEKLEYQRLKEEHEDKLQEVFNKKTLEMNIFKNLLSASVKTALSPISMADDALNTIVSGELTTDNSEDAFSSIVDDIEDLFDF